MSYSIGMATTADPPALEWPAQDDQSVVMRDVSWELYEMLLEARGESSVPRMAYLDGDLELMSPGKPHETDAKMIGRLLEAYAEERDLPLNGFGNWTVKDKKRKLGLEPDGCYELGPEERTRPELAIEVEKGRRGIDKLDIYRGLGVPEVWRWRKGRLHIYVLRGADYVEVERSEFLPELDLAVLTTFVVTTDQTASVKAFRAALRARSA